MTNDLYKNKILRQNAPHQVIWEQDKRNMMKYGIFKKALLKDVLNRLNSESHSPHLI